MMQWSENESWDGYYDVYYEGGQRFVVLEGLDPTDKNEPSFLSAWTHAHYDTLTLFYTVLFFGTLTYLITMYIAQPLIRRSPRLSQLLHRSSASGK